MTELRMKTATAESRMGSRSDASETMAAASGSRGNARDSVGPNRHDIGRRNGTGAAVSVKAQCARG
jgi:hypothetical protein